MAGWRDIKRKALGQVHETFAIPAVYLTHAAGTPIPLNARLHLKPMVTDQEGDFSAAATIHDLSSRVVIESSALPSGVLSRAYLIFGNSEAYITGASRPVRDGFVWVEVSEVPKDELAVLLAKVDHSHPVWARVFA